jgi:hypothetical protein
VARPGSAVLIFVAGINDIMDLMERFDLVSIGNPF